MMHNPHAEAAFDTQIGEERCVLDGMGFDSRYTQFANRQQRPLNLQGTAKSVFPTDTAPNLLAYMRNCTEVGEGGSVADGAVSPPPAQTAKLESRPPRPYNNEEPIATTTATSFDENSVRPERRVKLTRMRLRTAERLKESQNTAAMLTTFNEVDMTRVNEMRAALKNEFLAKHGVKLGFMSTFVKVCNCCDFHTVTLLYICY
jgi:hypothetical protein